MTIDTRGAAKLRRRSICISTITRNRPLMLQNLLHSYARMRVPDGISLHFLIVENNDLATLHAIVARFRALMPEWTVQYETEPQLGIAHARNRALECALAGNHDFMTFADDDEEVEPDWLVELLAELDASCLDIVGSPVRVAPISPDAPFSAKLVWAGLNRRGWESERKSRLLYQRHESHKLLLATGSWMGRLGFFHRTGLRFDDALGLAGGEDWRLYKEARKLGAKTGWTPYAIAYETVPMDRLTLGYHFRRDRDSSSVETCAKLAQQRAQTLLRIPGSIAIRVFKLCSYAVAAPFTRGETLVRLVACMGSITGICQGCLGKKPSHYRKTTGF